MIGLFCKRALQKRLYFAKETYNFVEQSEIGDVEGAFAVITGVYTWADRGWLPLVGSIEL